MKINVRYLAGTAMLGALGFVLMLFEIPIPIIPSFIKLDFSDLPEVIGAFAYGPVYGILIALIKNLLHLLLKSSTAGIGELSNFFLGAVFAFVAGLIYKKNRTRKGALIGGIVGAAAMGLICFPSNLFVVYPLYYSVLGFPKEAVLGMYQAIIPSMKNIAECLLVFNVPFTFVKGLISVVVTMIIYQPLRPILKMTFIDSRKKK